MKIDSLLAIETDFHDTQTIATLARKIEDCGFDGLTVAEMAHDPFLALGLCAHETQRVELISAIAVALSRSPMITAVMANDLNAWSQGRFTLGLGSQIKPHITKRYSMPWHGPAAQMKEYIQALHAIWDCWYDAKPLKFDGAFYTHKLMTPEFTPSNTQYGRPKVMLAAVGPLMHKTAAQVADGVILHGFCTEKHLREVLLPDIDASLKEAGRKRSDYVIQFPMFAVSGEDEQQFEKMREMMKYRIGFYGSTPAYRNVLETHGWGDLQEVLHKHTKEGRWDKLVGEISDEMLQAFAIVGEPEDLARQIKQRFGGLIDRTTLMHSLPKPVIQRQLEILRA